MSGLYLQAFTDCLVQDWRGHLGLFACLLTQWRLQTIIFPGLRSRGDITISGSWSDGRIHVAIQPWAHSADTLPVMVSQDLKALTAHGQAGGPMPLQAHQLHTLRFTHRSPIILTSG